MNDPPTLPSNLTSPERLAALARTRLLEAAPDREFDRFTRLAARTLTAPVSLISFLDDKFEHLYSHFGVGDVPDETRAQPLKPTFCYQVVAGAEPIVVADAKCDSRTFGKPFVGGAALGAYLGVPIIIDGQVIGSFCVIDHRPREWDSSDVETLVDLTQLVAHLIERREHESRLDESKLLLESMLAAGDIGTWTWDLTNDCIISGGCLARIFGFSTDGSFRIPLSNYVDRIHGEDQAVISEKIAAAVASGDHYNAEYRMVRPDGEIRWVIARGELRRDKNGKPTQFPGVVIDITEQKRLQQQLHDARSRLDSTLATGAIGTWEYDVVENIVRADANLARMFGVTEAEAAGGPLDAYTKAIHPDDRERIGTAIQKVLTDDTSYEEEYRLVGRDGSIRWVMARGRGEYDETGKKIRLPGVVVDITDTREGANRLRHSDAMFRLAAEAARLGIFEWSASEDRAFWKNDRMYEIFNRTREQGPTSAADFIERLSHPDDRDGFEKALQAAITQGRLDYTGRFFCGAGTTRWIQFSGQMVKDDNGNYSDMAGVAADVTEQVEGISAYRRNEEFQRLVFESVKDFSIFTADLEGRITTWNKGAENVFGFSEVETVGQPAAIVFTPEDRAAGVPEKEMQAAAEQGKGTDERWHLRKDGSRFFASGMVRPIKDDAGTLIGFTKVARDITATKLAQETIRQSDERYRALFNSMDEGFCILQLHFDEQQQPVDYRFLESNPAFETIVRIANPTGKWASEVLPDIDRNWHQLYARIARTREPERFEQGDASLDGRMFSVYAFPVGSLDEAKVAVLFNDITHRKLAEKAVADRANQLQRLAEISSRINEAHDVQSVLGLVTEEARHLIGANHAATTMVLDPRQPQPVNVFSHSEARRLAVREPQLDGLAMYELMQKANQSMRLTAAQLDAEPKWKMLGKTILSDATLDGWMAAPLVGHDGRVMGLLQLADKEDSEFTADDEAILIQLSRIASIAVENARLYQELNANDQRKDEFLAMLAHELRNPLGAISSGVDLVQRTQKPEMLAQLREMIKDQVVHLTHLIDDLLDVSRITQGKIELRKGTVELHAIVKKASELAGQQIAEKRHQLNIELPEEPAFFVADATRVEQVLNNLLTNAAKYSEQGRTITLRAGVETAAVVFRIIDEGFGISPEMLPRVFGLFTQVDATIDRARGGLGIGLTLVKSLVEMHGGTVEANSEGKGKGSEFIVRLPLGQPDTVETDAGNAQPAPTTGTGQVLIVDDNQQTARLTARLLASVGFTCETSHDGIEGLEKARSLQPGVLLLDIGLPGLNGYEVAQAVRREAWGEKATIIAVSGYGEEKARDRSRASGFDYHLTKPLNFDQLMTIIGKVES